MRNTSTKKRGELTCCPFHPSRLSHCLSQLNRQRQSPRRYEKSKPCGPKAQNLTAPKRVQWWLAQNHTGWYNHTRDIYRCCVQDCENEFARFDGSQTERQVNALIMSCLFCPPNLLTIGVKPTKGSAWTEAWMHWFYVLDTIHQIIQSQKYNYFSKQKKENETK